MYFFEISPNAVRLGDRGGPRLVGFLRRIDGDQAAADLRAEFRLERLLHVGIGDFDLADTS